MTFYLSTVVIQLGLDARFLLLFHFESVSILFNSAVKMCFDTNMAQFVKLICVKFNASLAMAGYSVQFQILWQVRGVHLLDGI